jgi:hypothetical protein
MSPLSDKIATLAKIIFHALLDSNVASNYARFDGFPTYRALAK